jgi:replicative superfamily II helicase
LLPIRDSNRWNVCYSSNPKLLAGWLQAKFYVSKYRPIPIEEHLVYDNAIYPTASAKEFFRTASQLSGRTPST